MRAIIVALCLLGASPARSNECFSLDKILLSVDSDVKMSKVLQGFRKLLAEFFFIKGQYGPDLPTNISWSTARELSRFLERKGIDVRVREDLYNKERESLFSAAVGGALVTGFGVGAYGSPKMKDFFNKFIASRKVLIGAGMMGGLGAIFSSWFGGQYVPEGSCDLVFSRSILGDAVPLNKLGFNEFKPEEPASLEQEGGDGEASPMAREAMNGNGLVSFGRSEVNPVFGDGVEPSAMETEVDADAMVP